MIQIIKIPILQKDYLARHIKLKKEISLLLINCNLALANCLFGLIKCILKRKIQIQFLM